MSGNGDSDGPESGRIDAHVHVVSVGLIQEYLDSLPSVPTGFREALERRQWGKHANVLPCCTPGRAAKKFLAALDRADIAAAVVMSLTPDSEWMRDFLTATGGRIVGLTRLDPRDPRSIPLLEREAEWGFRGVKLMPVNQAFRLSDPECRPFFEKVEELGLSCTIHYGVSVDAGADLRFADPTDLSPVARDHPGITFVIAHFGAGWFAETLRLAYQCQNVCVDTSGTNNWIDIMPSPTSLSQVFRTTLSAIGPERVLFGTDSSNVAPYRDWIAYSQRRLLEEIGVSEEHRRLILGGNAARIFRI